MRVLQHGEAGRRDSQRSADRRCAGLQASAGALGAASRARDAGHTSSSTSRTISPAISSACWPARISAASAGSGSNTIPWCRPTPSKAPGGDAGVIRIKGSQRGLAMALDGNGRWCYLDPQLGAMHAVAEAARNVACSGATPVGATNCLNFGNPEKPHIMWQFSQAVDGITKACEELEVPITGGNVSFYNETLGEGIYPTPVLGIVGMLEDVHKATLDFREAGRAIVLLRGTEPGDITDAEVRVWFVGVRQGDPGRGVGISRRSWNWSMKLRCKKD